MTIDTEMTDAEYAAWQARVAAVRWQPSRYAPNATINGETVATCYICADDERWTLTWRTQPGLPAGVTPGWYLHGAAEGGGYLRLSGHHATTLASAQRMAAVHILMWHDDRGPDGCCEDCPASVVAGHTQCAYHLDPDRLAAAERHPHVEPAYPLSPARVFRHERFPAVGAAA